MREVLLVDAVHLREVVHGCNEDGDLDSSLSTRTGPLLLTRAVIERLTFTARWRPDPASSRMFLSASQQALVLSAMLPSTRLPEASAGIWPETKIWPAAAIACDYVKYSLVTCLCGWRQYVAGT